MKFLARLCSAAASHNESAETLAQVALRVGGCLIPVNIQGQVGKGSQLPDLVEEVSAHCRGLDYQTFFRHFQPQPNHSLLPFQQFPGKRAGTSGSCRDGLWEVPGERVE